MTPTHVDDWDQHWKQFGEAAEIGPSPRYRRRLIFEALVVDRDDLGVEMLEVGSGIGEFAQEFLERYPNAQFLGLELSHTGVRVASRRVPVARFVQQDLLAPAPEDQRMPFLATHAVCSEVLEHLEDPVPLLTNAAWWMAPDCRLVITVPGGPMNAFYKHIGHRRHYSPGELAEVVASAGFRVEAAYGAGFPFFNLFRLLITARGEKLVGDVSGKPSLLVRVGMAVFELLFHCNANVWGWQTVVIARPDGESGDK
jgi:SAM-dependent methyltransferase